MAGCMVPYDSQGHLGMPYSQGYDEGGGLVLDEFNFAPEIMANVCYTCFISVADNPLSIDKQEQWQSTRFGRNSRLTGP